MKEFFKNNKMWLLPLLAMAVITPFTPILDMDITRYFYQNSKSFKSNGFYDFMYDYGVIPAHVTALAAFLVLVLSCFLNFLKPWRASALVLVLTMIIGAGIITHAILKDHWGRPRPKQVQEFGGSQVFRPYYSPNIFHQPEPSKSFSCGHCSMGFYFFALAIVGRRLNRLWLFWLGMLLALTLGVLLSLTRIAQGGHFLSDTLMTALIMWLTAYTCDWLVNSNHQEGR